MARVSSNTSILGAALSAAQSYYRPQAVSKPSSAFARPSNHAKIDESAYDHP